MEDPQWKAFKSVLDEKEAMARCALTIGVRDEGSRHRVVRPRPLGAIADDD
jgi:hypothetical protein